MTDLRPFDSPPFLIRRAQPTDEASIGALWAEMIAELHALDPRQPQPVPNAATIYAARLVQVLDDPDTCVFVAERAGVVIGYTLGALVDLQSDLFAPVTSGLIVDLCVTRIARRNGIGRALVAELMNWFKLKQAAYVELNVASANVPGRAFWTSVGGADAQIRMRIEL